MIVEDNALNMKLFRDLLEALGYRIVRLYDGTKVLPLARKYKPDLIIMDIQLPGVSGLEVIKWLKADDELKVIPVFAVSAFAKNGEEDTIRAGGCDEYLAKPLGIHVFMATVERYLQPSPN